MALSLKKVLAVLLLLIAMSLLATRIAKSLVPNEQMGENYKSSASSIELTRKSSIPVAFVTRYQIRPLKSCKFEDRSDMLVVHCFLSDETGVRVVATAPKGVFYNLRWTLHCPNYGSAANRHYRKQRVVLPIPYSPARGKCKLDAALEPLSRLHANTEASLGVQAFKPDKQERAA